MILRYTFYSIYKDIDIDNFCVATYYLKTFDFNVDIGFTTAYSFQQAW